VRLRFDTLGDTVAFDALVADNFRHIEGEGV
jgi:hypothetical protein